MSNEDRRRVMVEAALTVMLRKGIAATTARDMATEMLEAQRQWLPSTR